MKSFQRYRLDLDEKTKPDEQLKHDLYANLIRKICWFLYFFLPDRSDSTDAHRAELINCLNCKCVKSKFYVHFHLRSSYINCHDAMNGIIIMLWNRLLIYEPSIFNFFFLLKNENMWKNLKILFINCRSLVCTFTTWDIFGFGILRESEPQEKILKNSSKSNKSVEKCHHIWLPAAAWKRAQRSRWSCQKIRWMSF